MWNPFQKKRKQILVPCQIIFLSFKADLLSNDPKHAEQFREALSNLDEYLEQMYTITDSDNNGHINKHEFDNMHDEL